MNFLELVKIIIVLCFLIYACKLDLKSRIIPNKVWKFMLIFTIPITAFQVYETALREQLLIIFAFIGAVFMISFSYVLYRMNAYGGADAKALMCLAVIFPFYPDLGAFPVINNGFGIFSFSVLANSVIFAPFLMFGLLFRNLSREGPRGFIKNPLYYIAGYKIPVEKIGFHNLFEFVDEKGELKRVRRAVEPNEEIIARLKKSGLQKVWATPALPFIIFITFGYITAVFLGDVLFLAISFIL
ncbi:MAG: A24 family peptidase C-terminal domain-containing protein [Archaeoglobales archaeon]|nr:A24 family peptidase C-terminal domain-containing protein [Archaeoglobales archaeon]